MNFSQNIVAGKLSADGIVAGKLDSRPLYEYLQTPEGRELLAYCDSQLAFYKAIAEYENNKWYRKLWRFLCASPAASTGSEGQV